MRGKKWRKWWAVSREISKFSGELDYARNSDSCWETISYTSTLLKAAAPDEVLRHLWILSCLLPLRRGGLF
jgi:hypothetical protein